MCYAIPGKLVEINDSIGTVDYYGEKRKVIMDNQDVKIGDYVYAQGGVLLSRIPKQEAEKIIEHWKEIFFKLKQTDSELASIETKTESKNILSILQKINLNQSISKDEMLNILNLTNSNDLKVLYELANNIRLKENDNACCVHGIIEFSNHCSNDCHYCGIRNSTELQRYRMSVEEIISVAKNAVNNLGFRALVLQSGEDEWYDEEKLVKIVKTIREMGVLVFLSIGSRSKELYKKLYTAGARAVLLRFETSNKEIFSKLRPGTTLNERIDLIKYIKDLGYVLATGFMVGLPGETNEDIVNNILLTAELKPDMFSFGPFIPTENTPLEKELIAKTDLVLKTTALSRFMERDAKILVTTALETLDKSARKQALLAGANSLMVNVTPDNYKKLYSIYSNRAGLDDVSKEIKKTLDLLYSIGRAPTDIGIQSEDLK